MTRESGPPNINIGKGRRDLATAKCLDHVDGSAGGDQTSDSPSPAVYGARPLQRRRRTNAELGALDAAIVEAVEDEHPVTLRGVYYRVVSAGAVEKTEAGYRLVGRQLLKLRRTGGIPYEWITDGTRWITKPDSFTGIDQMLNDVAVSYRRSLWHDQAVEVHVFTEKDAISGVLLPVTESWDVPLGVLRGYSSESFAYSVAAAIKGCGKRAIFVYQLGDHDPSGLDAWRAFRETVAGFLGEKVTAEIAAGLKFVGLTVAVGSALGVTETDPLEAIGDCYDDADDEQMAAYDELADNTVAYTFMGGAGFHDADSRTVAFARIAVTEAQIALYDLPTRPTKRTDTRARSFAGESVEVDAIRPSVLRSILTAAIERHIDPEALRLTRIAEDSERETLYAIAGGVA